MSLYVGNNGEYKIYLNGTVYFIHLFDTIPTTLSVSGYAQNDSYGSAAINIVYPPIGDDVILSASDDIDITANGNVLEIRQAYQINIDKENGILEVI